MVFPVQETENKPTAELRRFATDAALAAKDGVFQLDAVEKELVHESFTVDTRDEEDHTFCGIMFDAVCETHLPAKYIELQTIWVRGDLGPITVWKTPQTWVRKQEEEGAWVKIYSGQHEASPRPRFREPAEYTALHLNEAIRLAPGDSCGLYIHSALPGDEGLVYDNAKGPVTYQDRVLKVLPGCAHLSNRPFGKRGFWGRPWRTNREFVGRIQYGVRWKMWSPEVHGDFPVGFQRTVLTMLMASRRAESHLYLLQEEIVLFIMNKCSWDWWGDAVVRREMCEAEPPDDPCVLTDRLSALSGRPYRAFSHGSHDVYSTTHSLYESLLGGSSSHMFLADGGWGNAVMDSEEGSDESEDEFVVYREEEEDDDHEDGNEEDDDEDDEEQKPKAEGVDGQGTKTEGEDGQRAGSDTHRARAGVGLSALPAGLD